VSTPQPPRSFKVGDRVRTKATVAAGPSRPGVVLEVRDGQDFDTLVAFDGEDPEGFWQRSSNLELDTPA
jgi:hypothetical protein